MTKVPNEKNTSNKENDLWNELNKSHSKFKNRRTLSFLSTNRRRISQFGTLKKNLKNRRLSLSQPNKKLLKNVDKTSNENFVSLTSIKSKLKKYADDLKPKAEEEINVSIQNKSTCKKISFKSNKQKHATSFSSDFNFDTIFSYDKSLSDYLKNHLNSKSLVQNEELNNKIDLEIRILDGILKLLNAICSNTTLVSNSSQSNSLNNSNSSNSSSTSVSASSLISSLDVTNFDDVSKCSSMGAQIAAALACNKTLIESNLNQSENPAFDTNSPEYNHVIQILTACKCLFVSHRKIAIFLQNLHELEKRALKNSDSINSNDFIDDIENRNHTSIFSALDISSSTNKNVSILTERSIDIETCKLVLNEIRIPLSWKWTDYVKASKNSESVNCKFATFAVIFLGNMIYDTQLLSNIDASVTDINFTESFVFDDVKPNAFEITIEVYAYELYNTTNNLLQSARKLAKQFTDFATFKRNNSNQSGTNQNVLTQMPNLFNNALTNSTNTYSYSMNKFKLIAKAVLTKNDLSDEVETKHLQIINDSSSESSNGTNQSLDNSSSSVQNQNISNIISSSNKLPLFDYFSCRLRTMATSSFI